VDTYDKRILDIIQTDFPLDPRPYAVVGERVGLTETETLARVRALRETGTIRRLAANFQSPPTGWRSTLCAAKVPDEKMEEFVSILNALPGVTHNYLRANEYNIWFTFIGPSWDAVCDTLADVTARTGIEILNMPAEKLFKIRVDFQMED